MKKLLLLLSAAACAVAVHAQQRPESILFNDHADKQAAALRADQVSVMPTFNRHGSQRTTTGGLSRWYNYGDFLAANYATAFSATYLWNDTTSVDVYSGGVSGTEYLFNTIVSVGMVCDPFVAAWNDPIAYPGEMSLTAGDAYMIDTVFISGVYYRNNSKPAPVDTLTLGLVYGDGTITSDLHAVARDTVGGNGWIYTQYGVDTLYYMRMPHDSIHNHVDTFMGGVTPVLTQLYLTNTDTSANYQAYVPMSISVPAGGNLPALSLSFKSGDASFTFGDTVFAGSTAANPYKYGMFRPLSLYEGSASSVMFPANSPYDRNQGEFRYEGINDPHHIYTPQWFWTSGGGAAQLQYPYFAFHIVCASCGLLSADHMTKTITHTSVYPNPANDMVTINFSLAAVADVSVSLTDVMGQVVAADRIANVNTGKTMIKTAGMPAGVYFYTVTANGERSTGRIVVGH